MSSESDKNVNDLSGAYALDAVTAEERSAVEAHLGESEEMRNEVTGMIEAASLLGRAVEPVEPSAELKTSIMALVASTPQLPQLAAPVGTLQQPGNVITDSTAAATGPVTNRQAPLRWLRQRAVVLTAAAASLALVVGGIAIANTFSDDRAQIAQANELVAINAASDFAQATVEVAGGGSAKLVWSVSVGRSALIANDLSFLPSEETYQLWYIDSAGARSAGTFAASRTSTTWRVLEGVFNEGDTVGMTVEPHGGSLQPTTDPILVVSNL
jgi:anti-sigma-K factor RskA